MQTEVYPLAMFAIGGMMLFVASNDLLIMFVALEVLSLPLYLICGLARRRRLLSQEAAVKYFLLGAFASAFFLYGLALVYGATGSIRFSEIRAAAVAEGSNTLLVLGLALLIVGLLFKASVAPFHTWTPDVYQGAPTPVTAFMAACTKVAAFGAILRLLYVAFGTSEWTWRPLIYGVAIVSMIVGAVLGLTQTDLKRMLAYSSIAHAGFLLTGVIGLGASGDSSGLAATMFYLLAYGLTTIGAFAVLTLVRDGDGEASHLSQWAGLASRSPLTAAIMSLFLLALAGIPLTSGFTAQVRGVPGGHRGRRLAAGRGGAAGQRGGGVLLPAGHRAHVLLAAGRRRPDGRGARPADDDRARDHRHGHPGAGHRARAGARPGRSGRLSSSVDDRSPCRSRRHHQPGTAGGLAPGLHPGVDHRPLAPRGSAGRLARRRARPRRVGADDAPSAASTRSCARPPAT